MINYDAFPRDGKYAVFALDAANNATGTPLGEHSTRTQAIAQMRKLYSAADESEFTTPVAQPVVAPEHTSKAYITPKPTGWLSRRKAGLTVYKGDDGLRLMFIVTSNGYEDRDNETILTKALAGYVDRAWSVEGKCLPYNPLLFWHKGEPIGDIVWTDMEGTFLLEVAKERRNARVRLSEQHTTTIKQIWDAFETAPYSWGASHGFKYPDSAKTDRTYKQIAKFETSILPLDAAANPYTFAGVIDNMNRDQVLDNLLKVPDAAKKFRKNINAIGKALEQQGLTHKAVEETDNKALLEDVNTLVAKIAGKFSDTPDPAVVADVTQMLITGMAAMAPAADDAEDPADEAADTPTEDAMAMAAPAMSAKQVKLLDVLVTSQEAQANDMGDLSEAMKAIAEAVKPIPEAQKAINDAMETFNKRLKAVEDKLGGAPRRASVDESTVVNDAELTAKAKEQTEKFEEFIPGSGIKLKPASANGNGR